MNWLAAIDARIWQAVIAGLFLAAGWLVNGWQNRVEARRLKAERLRDYHKALYAEIQHAIAVFWDDGNARRHAGQLVRRMRVDPGFRPFIAQERLDRVYLEVLKDIETLPRSTIDLVVAFYGHVASMGALADDLRDMAVLPGPAGGLGLWQGKALADARGAQRRRINLYLDYFHTRERAYLQGLDALDVIRAYSEGGRTAAEAALERINSRGVAQNDHQRGSA